jgi:death-on-curing protein
MKRIRTLTADAVVSINKIVCEEGGNRHHCYETGKVESALHSAFYPGDYPFQHGGVAQIAGALCFYLTKAHAFYDGNKRTALVSSLTFLHLNGWSMRYGTTKNGVTAIAAVIEKCADGKVDKKEMIRWFDSHKIKEK